LDLGFFFFRANMVRPDYNQVRQNINKCRDAIENSLSRNHGFSFNHFNSLIKTMMSSPNGLDTWNTWDDDEERKVCFAIFLLVRKFTL
jgi:hypothetical protein